MKYIVFLFLLAILISCKKENRFDCLKSTGNIISEIRNTPAYNIIIIDDVFDVLLTQDSTGFIELKSGENLLKSIKTEVRDSTLYISNGNKCNWARKYKNIELVIHSENIDSIIIKGECTFKSKDTLKYDNLSIDVWSHIAHVDLIIDSYESHLNVHAGTGDYSYRGNSHLSYLYCHGNARLYADKLTSSFTSILSNTTGNIYVNTLDVIHADIQSYGNIYYLGDPIIELKRTGDGNLIKIQ